ncbi:IPT/TIG domain-containing protein [Paenarthrobacter sp. PH39-S1]|uniref:IPT/TIG domain-containing protein n=1 Tax=Paenarthrobacter sp. PH39-S1 TaxID=3046204 RepID=UPI0024BA8474|nr:IPT/TIG domain-containing protein [Paenarthrobacter sp. PH39-S1]MDJ0356003.1 hypothetical protein [Paenarthrobacter sp. PH39-S1]
MKSLSMTLSSPNVSLQDGKGALTASVTNTSAAPERVVLGAFPGAEVPPVDSRSWTTIEEPLRTIASGATAQYEVNFDTGGAAPGTYSIKLIPYSADDAPEDYAELAAVVQLVIAAVPVKPKKKFPWVPVAAAIVVLILGVGAVWFFVARGAGRQGAQPAPSTTAQTPAAQQLQLASLQPAQGSVSGGTVVQLIGRFKEPTVVTLGGVSIPAARVSDTQFSFTTRQATQAGKVLLEVRSGDQLVGASLFEYTAEPTGGTGRCLNPKECVNVQIQDWKVMRDPGGPVIDPEPGKIFNPKLDGAIIDQLQKLGQ